MFKEKDEWKTVAFDENYEISRNTGYVRNKKTKKYSKHSAFDCMVIKKAGNTYIYGRNFHCGEYTNYLPTLYYEAFGIKINPKDTYHLADAFKHINQRNRLKVCLNQIEEKLHDMGIVDIDAWQERMIKQKDIKGYRNQELEEVV